MSYCKHGIQAFGFCLQCCHELLDTKQLHSQHPAIVAAHKMVVEHEAYETMLPAVDSVHEQHKELPREYLMALWIGINAKQQELEIESCMTICGDNHEY